MAASKPMFLLKAMNQNYTLESESVETNVEVSRGIIIIYTYVQEFGSDNSIYTAKISSQIGTNFIIL